jgi:hypothetical protein
MKYSQMNWCSTPDEPITGVLSAERGELQLPHGREEDAHYRFRPLFRRYCCRQSYRYGYRNLRLETQYLKMDIEKIAGFDHERDEWMVVDPPDDPTFLEVRE